MPRAWISAVASLCAVTAAGCAVAASEFTPREYRVVAHNPVDAAYRCMVSTTDSLGYTVHASDRANAFLRVERQYLPLNSLEARDILNVSNVERSDGKTTFKVTAWTEATVRGNLFGPYRTSDRVLADANTVTTRCGGGGTIVTWSDTTKT